MPAVNGFSLPASPAALAPSQDTFFIAFITSDDPSTGQAWCPDVRAALPHLKAAFSEASSPDVAFVQVGQRPEWKDPSNVFRTKWNVNNVPSLVRYERADGQVKETGRLVEDEILDEQRLKAFLN
ncbi:Thioredoxin domain-containing protein C21C3.12c [Paramyrothecium foliicola]|nr:Thioredoxin domain-containing protein C21C3.12c [Paramyrothecium foliicola]